MPSYKHPRPALSVDAVVFGVAQGSLQLLLIQRDRAPFARSWALPGGFVRQHEGLDAAVRRELSEEAGIRPAYLEQLYTFGEPKRDPRGRVVTVAYFALVRPGDHALRADTDARDARWFVVDALPKLAFDHRQIIDLAQQRLRAKVRYGPIGFDLLPESFTLGALQGLYQEILQRSLDKRNFRKKVLSEGLLRDTGSMASTAPRSRLYRFDRDAYARLTRNGFSFEI